MKINNETCELIANLEYLIGGECYNPSSYDGWNDIEGCEFRYPVNIRNNYGHFVKVKGNINRSVMLDPGDVNPESIKYMKYRFGANELFIGQGLIKVLEYLEERYSLDFEKLENEKKSKE